MARTVTSSKEKKGKRIPWRWVDCCDLIATRYGSLVWFSTQTGDGVSLGSRSGAFQAQRHGSGSQSWLKVSETAGNLCRPIDNSRKPGFDSVHAPCRHPRSSGSGRQCVWNLSSGKCRWEPLDGVLPRPSHALHVDGDSTGSARDHGLVIAVLPGFPARTLRPRSGGSLIVQEESLKVICWR